MNWRTFSASLCRHHYNPVYLLFWFLMQIKKNLLSEAMFSIISEAAAPHSVWWFNVPLRHTGVAGNTLLWEGLAAFRVVEGALDVCVCVCVPSWDWEHKIPESWRLEGTCGDNLVQRPCSKDLPPQTVLIMQRYSSSSLFFHHWIDPFAVPWQDTILLPAQVIGLLLTLVHLLV